MDDVSHGEGTTHFVDTERVRHGWEDQTRIRQRSQRQERDPIRVGWSHPSADLDGNLGFANAARSCQRQQTRVGQQTENRVDVRYAADERRR